MRLVLIQPHYVDDKLIDAGREIGDGPDSAHPWTYDRDIKTDKINKKAGQLRPLSRNMTPIDDEAKKAMAIQFGEEVPEADPTKAIPLQGTGSSAKVPPIAPKVTPTVASAKAEPKKG